MMRIMGMDMMMMLRRQEFIFILVIGCDNEEGADGYVLMNAESIRDMLTPVGRIIFSPVPRGWINDTLKDAQIAVNEVQKVLTFDSPPNSIPAG